MLTQYAQSTIVPGRTPKSAAEAVAYLAGTDPAPDVPCRTTVDPSGGVVECDFAYPSSLLNSTLVASVVVGECGSGEPAVQGTAVAKAGDGSNAAGVGADYVTTPLLNYDFDASEKNKAPVDGVNVISKSFCARADVINDIAETSVLAYMLDVTTSTTFAQSGDFETTVTTASFDATAAAASAERTITVGAAFGACTNPATSSAVAIGTVLDICVSIGDDDDDVTIKQIHSLNIKKDTNSGVTLTSPINAGGEINFVTSLEPPVNTDNSSAKKVKISTLMIPKIYDDGSNTIYISGIAELQYNDPTDRRLSSGERLLQSEEAAFSMEVELTKNDLPQVAMNEEESGAISAGVTMMAFAAGVAGLL